MWFRNRLVRIQILLESSVCLELFFFHVHLELKVWFILHKIGHILLEQVIFNDEERVGQQQERGHGQGPLARSWWVQVAHFALGWSSLSLFCFIHEDSEGKAEVQSGKMFRELRNDLGLFNPFAKLSNFSAQPFRTIADFHHKCASLEFKSLNPDGPGSAAEAGRSYLRGYMPPCPFVDSGYLDSKRSVWYSQGPAQKVGFLCDHSVATLLRD